MQLYFSFLPPHYSAGWNWEMEVWDVVSHILWVMAGVHYGNLNMYVCFQVPSNSLHREPLQHPAAEEDCSVPARNLWRQTGCGRSPEQRLQNTTQSSQPEGQDTHQSENTYMDGWMDGLWTNSLCFWMNKLIAQSVSAQSACFLHIWLNAWRCAEDGSGRGNARQLINAHKQGRGENEEQSMPLY